MTDSHTRSLCCLTTLMGQLPLDCQVLLHRLDHRPAAQTAATCHLIIMVLLFLDVSKLFEGSTPYSNFLLPFALADGSVFRIWRPRNLWFLWQVVLQPGLQVDFVFMRILG